jgi:hypothetical protein
MEDSMAGGKPIVKDYMKFYRDCTHDWVEDHQRNGSCMLLGESHIDAALQSWFPLGYLIAI